MYVRNVSRLPYDDGNGVVGMMMLTLLLKVLGVLVAVVVGGQTYARMASSCFPSGLGAYYLPERSGYAFC